MEIIVGIDVLFRATETGSTLPVEMDLADEYSVSRTVIRDAIKVLSGKGLVRTARRYGTRVCDQSQWNMLDPDVVGWRLSDRLSYVNYQREISDLRFLVEPGAAAMAAHRATENEKAHILALARKMATDVEDQVLETDVQFHIAIVRCTHNSLIQAFVPSLEILLRALFRTSYHALRDAIRYDPNPEIHIALAMAIAGGRAEEARHIAMAILPRGNAAADSLELHNDFWEGKLIIFRGGEDCPTCLPACLFRAYSSESGPFEEQG